MTAVRRLRRLLPFTTALLALLPAASAQAGLLVQTATHCDAQPLSRPFQLWADFARYTPAPAGTFESGTPGWTTDGASVVADNEPWRVAGAKHHQALRIPAGGSATSRPLCVGLGHPTLRLFLKRSGDPLSALRVDVLVESRLGLIRTLPITVLLGGTSWSPTLPLPIVANLLPLLPGDTTPVAFRFVPQGAADWVIDDVYVDPWRAR